MNMLMEKAHYLSNDSDIISMHDTGYNHLPTKADRKVQQPKGFLKLKNHQSPNNKDLTAHISPVKLTRGSQGDHGFNSVGELIMSDGKQRIDRGGSTGVVTIKNTQSPNKADCGSGVSVDKPSKVLSDSFNIGELKLTNSRIIAGAKKSILSNTVAGGALPKKEMNLLIEEEDSQEGFNENDALLDYLKGVTQ